MNNQQLQVAIDRCLTIVVEKGGNLKNYQPHFYERLCEKTLALLQTQIIRAGMIVQNKDKK